MSGRHTHYTDQVLDKEPRTAYCYKPKQTHYLCQALKILFVPFILLITLELQSHNTKLNDM